MPFTPWVLLRPVQAERLSRASSIHAFNSIIFPPSPPLVFSHLTKWITLYYLPFKLYRSVRFKRPRLWEEIYPGACSPTANPSRNTNTLALHCHALCVPTANLTDPMATECMTLLCHIRAKKHPQRLQKQCSNKEFHIPHWKTGSGQKAKPLFSAKYSCTWLGEFCLFRGASKRPKNVHAWLKE